MTEMGWGGGVECAAHRGFHLREADLYVEIADPVTGAPCEKGEQGEVVFTTLNRRGMPLIRYRTGDVAGFRTTPCPCGTVLRTLAPVDCRLGAGIEIAAGVKLSMAQLDEALFPISGIVDFSAEITRRAGVLRLSVDVVHNGEGTRQELSGAVAETLAAIPSIETALGSGTLKMGDIRVREMETFPLAFRKRQITAVQE
jgi:phenylacetate-CoA ligase